ncbi:MAG TPA: hypothetical protein VG370_29835 [Chloroflexota bacterium]|jgi:hypothetical protein|nr:hypothetical protein [Chloroflexota bacterium]
MTARLSRRRFALAAGALALPLAAACGEGPRSAPTATPAGAATVPKPTEPPAAAPAPTAPGPSAPPERTAPTQRVPAGYPSEGRVGYPAPGTRPAEPPVKPRDSSMTSPDFAIHVFLWGGLETTRRDLSLVREMGFTWVKQRFEWRYVEPHVKGKMEWNEPDRIIEAVARAGLKMIARVDNQPRWARSDPTWPIDGPPDKLSDFGDFLEAMANRYRGHVQAYQVWNEPNLAREWGNKPPNAKQYVEMLKVAHGAIKAADTGALVISGGLSPTTASGAIATPDVEFVKDVYAAGGKGYFDLLGVHAAGYKAPPELGPDEIARDTRYNHGEGAAGRIYGFRHAEDLRAVMVANGDAAKRVAILEFGWTSDPRPNSPYFWHAVSEEEKAAYLVRAFEFARKSWQPWIGPMTVIYVADPAWTKEQEQYYWSITNPDGSVRPAYRALQAIAKDAPPAPLTLTNQPAAATPSTAATKPAAPPAPTRPSATP